MVSNNWQNNIAALPCASIIELQQSWLADNSYYQTTLIQLESKLAQQQPFYLNICGPAGSGKHHLLILLYKLIADEIHPNPPLNMAFIDQYNWQINHYIDLLTSIKQQLNDTAYKANPTQEHQQLTSQSITEQDLQLEQQIGERLGKQPFILAIADIQQTLSKIGKEGSQKLFKWIAANPQISLLCRSTQAVNDLPFNTITLTPLTPTQAHELLQHNLSDIKAPPHSDAKLCSQILYALFAGNGHYYRQFIHLIGQPQLSLLTDQLNYMCQYLAHPIALRIKQLPAQQQQIISLLSTRLLQQQGALTVTDIAEQLRMTHQTASSQLKKMRDQQLVNSFKVGRQSYYQSADIFHGFCIAIAHISPLLDTPSGIYQSIDFTRQWFLCGAQALPYDDHQYFVVDRDWQIQHLISPMMPLIIRLQHHIDSYLNELTTTHHTVEPLFIDLKEKLHALGDNIINSPFTTEQQNSAIAHIDLLNSLITRQLSQAIHNPQHPHAREHALQLSAQLFEFVSQLNLNELWKHLGSSWVNTSALMASCKLSQALGEYILQLEQQESKLRSLSYSITNAHCLVYKAYGFTLEDNKPSTQQTLEQLRIRSDKRNSPQLAGAYCHSIKLTISYIANQDFQLAERLVKQMLELSHKYPVTDLYFASLWRLWAFKPQSSRFEQLIKLIDKVQYSLSFNHQLNLWLTTVEHSNDALALKFS